MPTLERPLDRWSVSALRDTVSVFRDLVRSHQEAINRLNVYPVPDGDTGTNMARTLDAVVAAVEVAPAELDPTCDAISHGSLMGARGNSGVILSQVMRGIASTFKAHRELDGPAVAAALTAASEAADQAVLRPVEGTILTVVRDSARAARTSADAGDDLATVLRAAQSEGAASLARTPDLLPVLADAGVVDAGGAGFLLLLDAALHVVAGEPLPGPPADATGPDGAAVEAVAQRTSGQDGQLDVSEQRYEVMYLVDLADERIDELKGRWGEIGDSIVVVGGDGIWNCHVHTNDIGAVIEAALGVDGRPHRIRVTDLFEEVSAEHAMREAAMTGSVPTPEPVTDLPAVTCAVVAVSSGPGITELFTELGVQAVVSGGQTLNPSTAELLAAVERVNAEHVVVLPGNKNIVPVAEQLDALTTRTVRVVPTRSMPEGLAALMVYDPESTAQVNTAEMRHAAEAIVAGEVTRAVRASRTPAGDVADGDWLGITGGDGIVAIAPDVVGATTALLDRLVGDACELVTVIRGADADDPGTAAIGSWLQEHRPGVEVEVHEGGQPLYPYLLGVE